MSSGTPTAAMTAGRPHSRVARPWLWAHPEAPWAAAAALAWVSVLAAGDRGHGGHGGWDFELGSWSVMIVAMMWPGALPAQRRVALDSLRRLRHATSAIFLGSYLAVWVAAGLTFAGVVVVVERFEGAAFHPGSGTVTVALAVALLWHLTPARQRALRRHHRRVSFAPCGWKGVRDLVRYGVVHGRACVEACGPLMLAMFLSPHDLVLMATLAAITVYERFQARPRAVAGAAVLGGMIAARVVGMVVS